MTVQRTSWMIVGVMTVVITYGAHNSAFAESSAETLACRVSVLENVGQAPIVPRLYLLDAPHLLDEFEPRDYLANSLASFNIVLRRKSIPLSNFYLLTLRVELGSGDPFNIPCITNMDPKSSAELSVPESPLDSHVKEGLAPLGVLPAKDTVPAVSVWLKTDKSGNASIDPSGPGKVDIFWVIPRQTREVTVHFSPYKPIKMQIGDSVAAPPIAAKTSEPVSLAQEGKTAENVKPSAGERAVVGKAAVGQKDDVADNSITNGCHVVVVGRAGFRVAAKGAGGENLAVALVPLLTKGELVKKNVTLRVGFTDKSTVNFAHNEAAGRYVMSIQGATLCEVLDNSTSAILKTVTIPTQGDMQSAEFYGQLASEIVAQMTSLLARRGSATFHPAQLPGETLVTHGVRQREMRTGRNRTRDDRLWRNVGSPGLYREHRPTHSSMRKVVSNAGKEAVIHEKHIRALGRSHRPRGRIPVQRLRSVREHCRRS